ncbi:hypothetical protein B808_478 [Fructilactobacillus florum 8D]|uniref:Uncharacterized protein n=2 Tax=Fructilactobacillus florum TaxID=640331 RepID=W9EEP9_9LACO|nr:hypothetical protein B807_811 [Fructilactobacillus florum 2F]ETO40603.1 hypothetical protein B808_478 [Fructilactobacillus florum 8D]
MVVMAGVLMGLFGFLLIFYWCFTSAPRSEISNHIDQIVVGEISDN